MAYMTATNLEQLCRNWLKIGNYC